MNHLLKNKIKGWIIRGKKTFFPSFFLRSQEGFYSQYGQDKFVCDYFSWKKRGTFVDLGANDGIQNSNTYFLEKKLQWNGIAVEANPEVFPKLAKNRKCLCVQVAVSEKAGNLPFRVVTGFCEQLSGVLEPGDLSRENRAEQMIRETGSQARVIRIPTKTLCQILEEAKAGPIDYLSIDIEGNEASVLRQLLAKETSFIQLISLENNSPEKTIELPGYRKITQIGVDLFFERVGFR